MTTEDEALDAARNGLREAGVQLDENGRVVPVSGNLLDIGEAGGGVIDAETAIGWALRVEAGEQAVLHLARLVKEAAVIVRENPILAAAAFHALSQDATETLAAALPPFIYGTSSDAVVKAATPLAEFRAAEAKADEPGTEYRVEYNLNLGLDTGSGWAAHDEVFTSLPEALDFRDTLARGDGETDYRVTYREPGPDGWKVLES